MVLVAYPGVNLLDVAGPGEVFSSIAEAFGEDGVGEEYKVEVVSTTGELCIKTSSGVVILATGSLSGVRGEIDTLLVPGGTGVWEAQRDEVLGDWLRRKASRAARVGSICTGAFVLAAAGLLDGRRATTHWRWCERLAREYPKVSVEPDPIFVRDGSLFTSAGVTAGMDLALALVEDDLGR
ncbi:AraC family transcriptional regulator, partial [Singulisphaera rosea]